MTSTQQSRKCLRESCGNMTTDPSGYCHHHRSHQGPAPAGVAGIPSPTVSQQEDEQGDWSKNVSAAEEVAKSKLADGYDLDYVDRGVHLNDEQVEAFFDGDTDTMFEVYDGWSDSRHQAAVEEVERLLSDNWDEVAQALEVDPQEYSAREFQDDEYESILTLVDEVKERNSSDLWRDLVRNTPDQLLRRSFDYQVPDGQFSSPEDKEEVIEDIASKLGIDLDENREALRELVDNAPYGGDLQVIWYADVEDATLGGGMVPPSGAELTDPYVLVFDSMNGSGHDVRVKGAVSFSEGDGGGKIMTDGSRGWDNVAGVHAPAYSPSETRYRFPRPESTYEYPEGAPRRSLQSVLRDRAAGVDCNSDESAEIKAALRNERTSPGLAAMLKEAFPLEWDEVTEGR